MHEIPVVHAKRQSINYQSIILYSLQANANANSLEKKQRAFDKTIQEWQSKVADLQSELENAQKEARSYSAELFRCKAQYEESQDSVEALRRENKNLAGKRYICVFVSSSDLIYILSFLFYNIENM